MSNRYPFDWLVRGVPRVGRWLIRFSIKAVVILGVLYYFGLDLPSRFWLWKARKETAAVIPEYAKFQAMTALKENESATRFKEIIKPLIPYGWSPDDLDDNNRCMYLVMMGGPSNTYINWLSLFDDDDVPYGFKDYFNSELAQQPMPKYLYSGVSEQEVMDPIHKYIDDHETLIRTGGEYLATHDSPEWEMTPGLIRSDSRPSPKMIRLFADSCGYKMGRTV